MESGKGVRRLARKHNLRRHMRQINPTGKSFLIYGIRVKPQSKKYFAFPEDQISGSFLAIPS